MRWKFGKTLLAWSITCELVYCRNLNFIFFHLASYRSRGATTAIELHSQSICHVVEFLSVWSASPSLFQTNSIFPAICDWCPLFSPIFQVSNTVYGLTVNWPKTSAMLRSSFTVNAHAWIFCHPLYLIAPDHEYQPRQLAKLLSLIPNSSSLNLFPDRLRV